MKLLERINHLEDAPVHVGHALRFERPTWLVTCVLNRREIFGKVSSEAAYEVAAHDEEEARASVRSFVLQSRPGCVIESLRAERQPRGDIPAW